MPVSVRDPGPDGTRRQRGRRRADCRHSTWRRNIRALPIVNRQINVDDSDADYHTFEITGTKRMSNRWSLLASYGWTKSFDQAGTIQGNAIRANALPVTPNDKINTEDGRQVYTRSSVKLSGTWNSPWWDISFSPMMRYQQGVPFGRTFSSSTLELSAACASSPSRWARGGRTPS